LAEEATALGSAYAAANLRLDQSAPEAFIQAFQAYREPKRKLNDYYDKKLLGLRLNAVKRGFIVDKQVTSGVLRDITGERCLVSLETFVFKGQKPSNPSVDRLFNDGTYALANLCMFTQRVNQAKGAKTFEEVLKIAVAEKDFDSLSSIEWARLTSLMYGAWDAYNGERDPYLIPLSTYPGAKMFTTQSQLVQLLILRACLSENWPDSMSVFGDVTRIAGEPTALLENFMTPLREALRGEAYAPTAWLIPKVFEGFVGWYHACKPAIDGMMAELHHKYQQGIHPQAMVERWKVEAC